MHNEKNLLFILLITAMFGSYGVLNATRSERIFTDRQGNSHQEILTTRKDRWGNEHYWIKRDLVSTESTQRRIILRTFTDEEGFEFKYFAGSLFIIFHDHVTLEEVEDFVEKYEKFEFIQHGISVFSDPSGRDILEHSFLTLN